MILHLNDQFHSGYANGIPRPSLWRRPLARIVIVSVVPVDDVKKTPPMVDKDLADYVVLVPASPAKP